VTSEVDLIGVEISQAQPRLAGTELAVAEVVRACHATTIEEALAALAIKGLDRSTLEPLLSYCAERRCVGDDATCPGCRRGTEKLGLITFDDFVAHHAWISFETSKVRLQGNGSATLTAPSLESLSKSWAGEEYWYWARRVIRKLRHGVRRAGQSGAPPPGYGATPALILVRPQLADNIGMTARAMANFGLEDLRLVEPRDGWPNEKARIAASGANFIIDGAQTFGSLLKGVADLHWVCATSARQRDLVKPVVTPEQAIAQMRGRLAAGQRCGILFGPERNGLETEEVAIADAVVMAPVNSNFASLNVAQAVLLLSYEWMKQVGGGTLGRVTTYETPLQPGLRSRGSAPATKDELAAFFAHLEQELDAQGFLHPPEKRPTMVDNIRSMFTRMGATEQEIRTLRGIVKALVHGKRTGRRSP
jgi:tRNA/rRNA methyltransferase